jgi:alpha-L-fucosidase 2
MISCQGKDSEVNSSYYRVWFNQPADKWEETLPLGNGRIGIMPDGGIYEESLVLNEITLWSGGVQDANNPEAGKHLPEIQRLLFEGRNDEAQDLVYKTFVCKGAGSGFGTGNEVPYGSFEMLGMLRLNFDIGSQRTVNNYYRELSLDNAVAKTCFTIEGVNYEREYFTSFTDDVALIRLSADKKGAISLNIAMERPRAYEILSSDGVLVMQGQLNNGTNGKGMRYMAKVKPIIKGGELLTHDKSLEIKNADEVVIIISNGTDYKSADFISSLDSKITAVENKDYSSIKDAHIEAYKKFFNRVSLNLGANKERETLTTPQRLLAFADNPDDNGLIELYFQYGRYLLISSAHAQVLPPNLQGLWSNTITTPWNGDYHLNINLQMNHWPAEITNLPEMHRPLIELTKSLVEPGTETARVFYNANGWVAHMMTNVWGYTAPGEHPSWGATNTGGAWLTAHLWEHFEYSQDVNYLKEIYPVLKGSAQFFMDMLIEDPNTGWLVTAPSTSPENSFFMPGTNKEVNICMGPTMDNQLIRELFRNTRQAAEILGVDKEFSNNLVASSQLLPPNQISRDGRLMEWIEDYVEADPLHRHVSHLYGLHPGNEITPEQTPELAMAARKSLIARGDGGTGWSRAWKINFWARLHDGNHAYKLLKSLLEPAFEQEMNFTGNGGTYPNLFCAHPPFQMDGNFGGTAGIAEMFIQSHAGFINLLPALPDNFASGSFSGLRVRGEGIVGASWETGKLQNATLEAGNAGVFKIKMPAEHSTFKAEINGQSIEIQPEHGMLTVDLAKSDRLSLHFSVD